MKVLYVALGQPDYLCDTVMHGLYNVLGEDLTHSASYDVMYADYRKTHNLSDLYGKGFTVWGLLPEKFSDNSDIENKIKNKYFDYIIYGSITRCADYINLVLERYPKNKIIFLNGEDDTNIPYLEVGVPMFKRELSSSIPGVFPISFSIPAEKLADPSSVKKIKQVADYRPNSHFSYAYNTEEAYYHGYQEAYYGVTHKKAGWDCMRHYEILANYCVPYFPDLKDCPVHTMTNFPKEQILLGNELYESNNINELQYQDILSNVFEYTKKNLTTVSAAKYVLDTISKL